MYPVMSNPSHYLEKENFLGSHGKRKRKKKMHIRQPVEFFASPVYPSTPTSVQMGLGATESAGNRSWDNTALPSGVEWGQPGELWVSKAGVVQFCKSWLLCFYTCCSVGHSNSIKEPAGFSP